MLKRILYSTEYRTKKDMRYKLKPGDNIWSVSREFTGDPEAWKELVPCNAHIHDIHRVYSGELITIPHRWLQLKKLVELGFYDTPRQFGRDLVNAIIKSWITFYQFNAPESDRFVKCHGRLMDQVEVVKRLNHDHNHNTILALYWILLNKFTSVFTFKLFSQHSTGKTVLSIENTYYLLDTINLNTFMVDVILIEAEDITEINFYELLRRFMPQFSVEDVLKIAAFHQQLDVTQIPDIANVLCIDVKGNKK